MPHPTHECSADKDLRCLCRITTNQERRSLVCAHSTPVPCITTKCSMVDASRESKQHCDFQRSAHLFHCIYQPRIVVLCLNVGQFQKKINHIGWAALLSSYTIRDGENHKKRQKSLTSSSTRFVKSERSKFMSYFTSMGFVTDHFCEPASWIMDTPWTRIPERIWKQQIGVLSFQSSHA